MTRPEQAYTSVPVTEEPDVEVEDNVERFLYISHLLSTWNSRLFEFGAYLFLSSIYRSTLLPASIYALVRAAAAALLSPWLGDLIDRHDRLAIVRASIGKTPVLVAVTSLIRGPVGQRVPTFLSCAVFAAVLHTSELQHSTGGFIVVMLLLSVCAAVEKLSFVTNSIAVERDWVVVLAQGDEARLSRLNARMRRIDLFCKLLAPLTISLLDDYSTLMAVVATGCINAVSCLVEYVSIARVYHAVPRMRGLASSARSSNTLWTALKTYLSCPVVLPSLTLSLLYLTALSFAGQLITFLLAPPLSMTPLLLSVVRGVAASVELSATFLAPIMVERIGPVRAGSWFLNAELIFICVAAAALWSHDVLTIQSQTVVLVTAVVLSRLGLWGFDLSAQQQIQAGVPENNRGAFSSIEAGLQNIFEMSSFAATIVWMNPRDFKYPALLSASAVLGSAMLYAWFVRQNRGHLLHWDQGLCGSKYWQTHFSKTDAGFATG